MYEAMCSDAQTKFIAVKCNILRAQSLLFLKKTTKISESPLIRKQKGILRQTQ